MTRRLAPFALAVSLAVLPLTIACGRGEDEAATEALEAAEKGEEALEAAEEGEENEATEEAKEGEENEAAEEASEAADAVSQAALMKDATVDEATARRTALAEVPGGKVTKVYLEMEDNLLIWSLDITVAGKEGLEEIHVDAKTGKMVKHEHEAGGGER